jgi:hypothetical protein
MATTVEVSRAELIDQYVVREAFCDVLMNLRNAWSDAIVQLPAGLDPTEQICELNFDLWQKLWGEGDESVSTPDHMQALKRVKVLTGQILFAATTPAALQRLSERAEELLELGDA